MAGTLSQRIDGLLRAATDRGDVPGVVAVIADGGDVVYAGASGKRTLGGADPFTPDTIAFYASMSKAITATAAMQQVERGKLSLDAPAASVCPEIDELQVLDGLGADGAPKLRKPKSRMTLRQMLTHTCGSSYEFCDPAMLRYLDVTKTPGILSATRATMKRALLTDPGERWDYGLGIDWAGRMVETVSGLRLGEYLERNLFAPLGMRESGFGIPDAVKPRLAGVHARQPDGGLASIPFAIPGPEAEVDMGGHGLFGPMTDYVRFLRAILGGGSLDGARILEEKTAATMRANQTGDIAMRPIRTSMPDFTNDVEFLPGVDWRYAISFATNLQDLPGMRSAGSLAWAGITNSYYWIDPKKQVTGVVLTQILPFFDAKVLALTAAVEQEVYRGS
ncbi:MAG: serine hydrolase domain-containing protein [Candidatus Binatia bacterium]